MPPRLRCVKGVEHEINVRNTRPIKQRHYPMSDRVQEEMHKQVREMLRQGVIEPSQSSLSNPIAMARGGSAVICERLTQSPSQMPTPSRTCKTSCASCARLSLSRRSLRVPVARSQGAPPLPHCRRSPAETRCAFPWITRGGRDVGPKAPEDCIFFFGVNMVYLLFL